MKSFFFCFFLTINFCVLFAQDVNISNQNINSNTTINTTGKVIMNNTQVTGNVNLDLNSKNGASIGPGSKIDIGSTLTVSVNNTIIDADSDGMDDNWETTNNLTDPAADADNDGYSNLIEYQRGTNPNDPNDKPSNLPPDANNPPVATNDTANVTGLNSIIIDVLANDSDVDGDTLTIISRTNPAFGSAVIENNKITYTSIINQDNTDTFTYTISDGNGGQASATIYVNIIEQVADNPPVVFSQFEFEAIKSSDFTFDLYPHISDENKNTLN